MKKDIAFILLMTGSLLAGLSLYSQSQANATSQATLGALRNFILVGRVVKVEGRVVTLAAAVNPNLTKIFDLDPATEVLRDGRHISQTRIKAGMNLIVRQDVIGATYRTRQVEWVDR